MPSPGTYIVVREWKSKNGKRTFRTAVGIIPTYSKAVAYMQKAKRDPVYAYPPSTFFVCSIRGLYGP